MLQKCHTLFGIPQYVGVTEESVSFQSTDGAVEEVFIGDIIGSEAANHHSALSQIKVGQLPCDTLSFLIF